MSQVHRRNVDSIKRHPRVTAAATGNALPLFTPDPSGKAPGGTIGRMGWYLHNPDATNTLYIYKRMLGEHVPVVAGSSLDDDICYKIPAGTTYEADDGPDVIVYVGCSASTIVVTPKEVF